jgi:hypothetical protein
VLKDFTSAHLSEKLRDLESSSFQLGSDESKMIGKLLFSKTKNVFFLVLQMQRMRKFHIFEKS